MKCFIILFFILNTVMLNATFGDGTTKHNDGETTGAPSPSVATAPVVSGSPESPSISKQVKGILDDFKNSHDPNEIKNFINRLGGIIQAGEPNLELVLRGALEHLKSSSKIDDEGLKKFIPDNDNGDGAQLRAQLLASYLLATDPDKLGRFVDEIERSQEELTPFQKEILKAADNLANKHKGLVNRMMTASQKQTQPYSRRELAVQLEKWKQLERKIQSSNNADEKGDAIKDLANSMARYISTLTHQSRMDLKEKLSDNAGPVEQALKAMLQHATAKTPNAKLTTSVSSIPEHLSNNNFLKLTDNAWGNEKRRINDYINLRDQAITRDPSGTYKISDLGAFNRLMQDYHITPEWAIAAGDGAALWAVGHAGNIRSAENAKTANANIAKQKWQAIFRGSEDNEGPYLVRLIGPQFSPNTNWNKITESLSSQEERVVELDAANFASTTPTPTPPPPQTMTQTPTQTTIVPGFSECPDCWWKQIQALLGSGSSGGGGTCTSCKWRSE